MSYFNKTCNSNNKITQYSSLNIVDAFTSDIPHPQHMTGLFCWVKAF